MELIDNFKIKLNQRIKIKILGIKRKNLNKKKNINILSINLLINYIKMI